MSSYLRRHLVFGSDKNIVGDMKTSARTDDHVGWLKCDGRSLSTTVYSKLFAVIGYSFGGSGGTFNLPNPAGRVLGITGEGSGLTSRSLGDISGLEQHTLTVAELAEHTHTIDASGEHNHGTTQTAHSHSYSDTYRTGNQDTDNAFSTEVAANESSTNQIKTTGSTSIDITINNDGEHTHNAQNTGSNRPFSLFQPTMFVGNSFIYSGLRFVGTRGGIGQTNN